MVCLDEKNCQLEIYPNPPNTRNVRMVGEMLILGELVHME